MTSAHRPPLRFPASLRPGDTIAVTASSAGVSGASRERLDFAVEHLRRAGYDVVLGECLDGSGLTSAPAHRRAGELTEMLCDPQVRCVLPPWGGETAIDLVDLLDWDRLALADPTWLVGYSDLSTLLVPVTTRLGWATVHGDNLLDTPYQPPLGLLSWLDLVAGPGPHRQTESGIVATWRDFVDSPRATSWAVTGEGRWRLHGAPRAPGETWTSTGRLVGGCIEVMANLAGTRYGDVAGWGAAHADEGLLIYLEAAEADAATICRHLHGLRLAGWFEHASAVLVGRTAAPDHPEISQEEAVLDALGRLDLPIVLDLEIGHVGPHLPLVNGALAEVAVDDRGGRIVQRWT